MENEFLVRMMGSSGAIDWVVVFLFALVAVVYFLAPAAGYQSERRGLMLVSLYLLLGYALLVLLQVVLQYLFYLGSSADSSSGKSTLHVIFIFGILKLLLFIASQGAFVFGLQGLRRGSSAG